MHNTSEGNTRRLLREKQQLKIPQDKESFGSVTSHAEKAIFLFQGSAFLPRKLKRCPKVRVVYFRSGNFEPYLRGSLYQLRNY